MRVLMISYTSLLQRGYRWKCDEICRTGKVDLTVLTPPAWREVWAGDRTVAYEPGEGDEPYRSVIAPIFFAGNGHIAVFRRRLGGLLAEVRPDVIDLEREPWSWAAAQVLWEMRRCPGARLVFHASQTLLKRYPPPFRQIERAVYRRAHAALARSEAAREILRARGFGGEARVIPHGVDARGFNPVGVERPREPVVGFIGALTRRKGVEHLLGAVARLKEPVRCLVVGDGPMRAELERLAEALGIRDRVEFAGAVPHREVADYFGRMSVFVLPTVSLPGWEERFGRVLLEAMAMGLPVVGSDSGQIPEVLGGGGVVVGKGDETELLRALEDLIGDPARASALGERGRRRVEEKYSWETVARATVQVYEDVLG